MRPIFRVKFTLDGEVVPWGAVADTPGEVTIHLSRDAMGCVSIASAEVKPDEDYSATVLEIIEGAGEYHRRLTELQSFGSALTTDLHWLHKYLDPK